MHLNNIIIHPYHTEKSFRVRKLQDPSCLVFLVNPKANKHEILIAFKSIYNIDPLKINIVNRKSTKTRTGTAKPGFTKALKLAYITLPKGIQIAITKEEIEEAAKQKQEQEAAAKPKKVAKTNNPTEPVKETKLVETEKKDKKEGEK